MRRARAAVEEAKCWVSATVLLETEWVLRGAYGFRTADIVAAFRRFAGLDRVSLEAQEAIAQALDWTERGLEFADALHLAMAADQDGFLTFDRKLVRAAARLGVEGVRSP
jgi:predicted nucleic-acid-binding protein